MMILGLTGQSGAGKSFASKIFAKYGVPSINADEIYHNILNERSSCTKELTTAFGTDILDNAGLVDRKKLSNAIFASPNCNHMLHTLNAITHKYIMTEMWRQVQLWKEKGVRAVLLDAPQLFEAGVDRDCDVVIGVIADEEIRISRVMARDRITKEAAKLRLNAQHDETFFRSHCHIILENNTNEASLEEQIRHCLVKLGVELVAE